MDTVKRTLKYLTICILMLFSYTNVHAAQETVLTFNEDTIIETVSGSGYTIKDTDLAINQSGVYRIKGSSGNGTITVKKGTTNVILILDNLDLTSSKTSPLTINKNNNEVILLLEGTNTLVDNENPDNEFSTDTKVRELFEGAAIKIKDDSSLSVSGSGTLNINSINKNGIKGGDNSTIKIGNGTLNVTSTGNGISSDHQIIINGGNITINSGKEGLKASPDEVTNTSVGKITINGGIINITASEDGIQADGDIIINNKSNITINSVNDGIQTRSNFTMNNGTLDIFTYNGHYAPTFDKDTMSSKGIKASISESPVEGATNSINIYGGKITIESSDDALHSDGNITITRGILNIASWDDGIHADSKLVFGTQNGLERDPYIEISDSNEGIEAANIYFYSGKIKVKSRDDGINAAGGASGGEGEGSGEHFNPEDGTDNFAIYGYGGNIYVDSGFDGLDANGSIYLYGGNYTIYSEERGGTNSALDRDAHLVIQGATVFTSGSVGTNGIITSIETSQKYTHLLENKDINDKIAIKDNGVTVFNDTLIKNSEYIFFTSPELGEGATVEDTDVINKDLSHAWIHPFDDGVITTPATIDTPGVITYTCTVHGDYHERITYFYDNDVTFNIHNNTNGNAKVSIGNFEEYYDFTTLGATPMIVESEAPIYLVSTSDSGATYNKIDPISIEENKIYTYTLDASLNQDLYVIYKGDTNHNGYIASYDELLIRKSMLDPSNPLYRPLSALEILASDVDADGDIDEDDITYIQNAQAYLELNHSFLNIPSADYVGLTNSGPITLDGINPGTVDVYLKTTNNITLDSLEAMIIPKQHFTVQEITPIVQDGTVLSRTDNGMLYLVNTDGYNLQANENLFKITLAVDPNTPTGDYDINYVVGVYVPHNEENYQHFGISTTVHIDGVVSPYQATFVKDAGVKQIDVYRKKNSSKPEDKDVAIAYARNEDTGEVDVTGNGRIDFRVKLEDGYVISSITIDDATHYKNLKGPADTEVANKYRITKVKGDMVVTITTKQADNYDVTFIKGSGVKRVDFYHTQDYTTVDESDVTTVFARNEFTGEVDVTGEGQANFKVVLKNGYKLDSVTVDGSYKNLKSPSETGVDNLYRITKISGDIVVNVKTKAREAISLEVEDLDASYQYTEGSITPEVTVKIAGTDTVLTKDVDYTLSYGENKEIGQNSGSIIIKNINTSDYIFSDHEVNFDIVPFELTTPNVTAQNSVAFTGELLSPKVTVTANNKTLVKDQDYTVSYADQDATIGEFVKVTVTGIGNYTGTVANIEVQVVNKEFQTLSFDEPLFNVKYGTNFIKTATLTNGDGEITYSSSNNEIASVNPFTGAVIPYKKGSVIIKATASETDTYAETTAQYTLVVEPTDIHVQSASAQNKEYDGTTDVTVSNLILTGQVNDYNFVEGVDYTYTAEFSDASVGDDKEVTITITLDNSVLDRFVLSSDTFVTTASIYPKTIEPNDITLDNDSFTYDGNEKNPIPTIIVGSDTLVKNTDYTVTYENNVNAGTGYVVITGINNYQTEGVIKVPFTINKLEITPQISNINDVIYNGSEQKPEITVTYNNVTLVKNTDYTVKYEDNINAGEAKIKISPVSSSNYTFTENVSSSTKAFNILPYTLTSDDVKLEYYFVKHDGTEKEPNVTVTANQITLDKGVDFKAEYSNNINVGTEAKVTITSLSYNYTGTVEVYFEITNKDVLDISGISDNQIITYTGDPVELSGNITVAPNDGDITASDLTIKYYNSQNQLIEKPTNVGSYYVIYSYSSNDFVGDYKVNFEITKAKSSYPSEINQIFRVNKDNPLSIITFETNGLSWVDDTINIEEGYNTYNATYLKNNDSTNYDPIDVKVNVYGKSKINITTSVLGNGGTISEGFTNVVEGDTKTIYFTPNNGFTINKVTVNGEEVGISDNMLELTAEKTDLDVVASFEGISYELNIDGSNVEIDPNGIISVDYNSSKNIVITSKAGYRLTSAIVNNEENINNVTNNTLVISNITNDTNITITAKKIEYNYIEGARQTYTINESTQALFKIDANYNLFKNGGKVYIDNELIGSGKYTASSGSIVLLFNKDYLDTLSVGVHTLDVILNDGGVAQTTFTIAKVTTRTIVNGIVSNSVNAGVSSSSSSSKNSSASKSSINNGSSKTTTDANKEDTKTDNVDNKEETTDTNKKSSSNNKTIKNKQSKTNDNILIYIIVGVISLLTLTFIIIFAKKDKKEKDDLDI